VTDKRDAIAELLMAQEASRWDQLPAPSIPVEDRRSVDPLAAYVTPAPLALQGTMPVRSMEDLIDSVYAERGAMVHPGPMPLDMGADIEAFARGPAKAPSQPEQFGGPRERGFETFPSAMILSGGWYEPPPSPAKHPYGVRRKLEGSN